MSDETRADLERHYKSQREHAETIFDAMDEGNELPDEYGPSDPTDALYEWPLEVSVKRHVEVLLTFGGPNIWLDAEVDDEGDVTGVTYHAHWGGDSFERTLSRSDALFRVAEHFTEGVIYE